MPEQVKRPNPLRMMMMMMMMTLYSMSQNIIMCCTLQSGGLHSCILFRRS
jgi:hypothetical protein